MNQTGEGPRGKLGEYLASHENLNQEVLADALETQEMYRKHAIPSRIGEVLVDSGACTVGAVAKALHLQRDQQVRRNSIGQVLLELGYITEFQLEEALETHLEVFAPLGEVLLSQGICSEEQLAEAIHIQQLRRISAVRLPLSSKFDPMNVMELLVEESIDHIMQEQGACSCDRCRSNVIAMALNGLAPRYVSDMQNLLRDLGQYREEYEELVQLKIKNAAARVRKYPKLSCRSTGSRVSGEVLGTVTGRISNRHIHLTAEHVEQLFGPDYRLSKWRDLVQPGQYSAKETVVLRGPKGLIEKVRVLGPPRNETQVEISGTDQFKLGIHAPVRGSGKLDDTPGVEITGPGGTVTISKGVIRAWRHIHMAPGDGEKFQVQDGELVNVRLKGDRKAVLEEVLVRITDTSALEMHIDTDEANAAGVAQESECEVIAAG